MIPFGHTRKIPLPISRNFGFFLAVFLPAALLRIGFLLTLDEQILFLKYPYFADKLASGESIGDRLADLSPFYLYFLTLFRWLTTLDWSLLKLLQALLGALNCWLTAELGRRVYASRTIGLLAGWGMAGYGNLIVLETTLEPTVFVIFFNLLAIICLYRFTDTKVSRANPAVNRWLLCSGVFTGLSIITKPSFLLFIPLAGIWMGVLAKRRSAWFLAAKEMAIFSLVALSLVFTITLRNYVVLNDYILVTADAGKVFYHGNARNATALKWAGLPDQGFIEEKSSEPDYAHAAFRQIASEASGRKLRPSESSRYWTQKTMEDITAEPSRYLGRQIDKFLFFFSDYELHYIASAYKEYKASLGRPYLRYAILISLGLAGMVMSLTRLPRLLPLYGTVALYLLSGLIYIVQSRYRIPISPYLCVFAAYTLEQSYRLLRGGRVGLVVLILVGILGVYASSRYVLNEEIAATDNWYLATKHHYEIDANSHFKAGRYQQATDAATQALAIAPAFGPAYVLRGKSHALMNDPLAAIEDFKKVVQLHPNRPEGYRNLGFAYLLHGESELAQKNFETTLVLDPADTQVTVALKNLKATPALVR